MNVYPMRRGERIREFSLGNATVSVLRVQQGKIVAVEREIDVTE